MTTEVVTVTPGTSIREVMELLAQRHIGGVPVVRGGAHVGVVTGTDIIAFLSEMPRVTTEREASEATNAREDAPVEAAAEPERVTANAVFAGKWNDAGASVVARTESVAAPEWSQFETHDVSEAMTRPPLATLSADADVETAANLMTEQGIHRILVTDGDALVGIVTAMDVTKAVASGLEHDEDDGADVGLRPALPLRPHR